MDMVFKHLDKIQILYLTSQSVLCHHVFCGLFCLFFLSSCFLKLFAAHSFRVFYNFLTVLRGCFKLFYTHRHNTSSSLALLTFLSFFSSLSFLSPLFSFFPPLSSFSLSLSLSLFMQIFGAATAAMPHGFRRACPLSVN